MKKILTVISALWIAACSPVTEAPPPEGLVISEAMVRTPMGGQTTTAGYFQVTNHTSIDDALISVSSPVAESVEMHMTENTDGKMRMRKQVSIDIKAGETLTFAPGGHHLMLFDVNLPKDQTDAALTLKFKHAPDMTIIAEIADGVSHTGHH